MEEYVIILKNVNKTYFLRERKINTLRERVLSVFHKKNPKRQIQALKDINISIKRGEILGIVGRNGSGKSTLMNIILGAILPDKGAIVNTKGIMIKLSLGIGVDKNMTARENIYLNGSMLGLSFKRIGEIFDDIIKFAGLADFIDTEVKFFSKGMKSRLLFSIAMHAEADIFLLDEFFGGVGDREFKEKSEEVFKKSIVNEKTIVMISHALKDIEKHCDRVLWLEKGKIKMLGNTNDVLEHYKKSYNNQN